MGAIESYLILTGVIILRFRQIFLCAFNCVEFLIIWVQPNLTERPEAEDAQCLSALGL